jgi:hypothetical protein
LWLRSTYRLDLERDQIVFMPVRCSEVTVWIQIYRKEFWTSHNALQMAYLNPISGQGKRRETAAQSTERRMRRVHCSIVSLRSLWPSSSVVRPSGRQVGFKETRLRVPPNIPAASRTRR